MILCQKLIVNPIILTSKSITNLKHIPNYILGAYTVMNELMQT